MASIQLTSRRNQSDGSSTSHCIIERFIMVSMLMDFFIIRLTTGTVIYPHHWLCLRAPCCAMLSWSSKRTKVVIQKLPSQSWTQTDLITRTTSTTRMTVATLHPTAL
jgi:hypothetical protein